MEKKSNGVCENAGEKKGLEDRKLNENCINPCPKYSARSLAWFYLPWYLFSDDVAVEDFLRADKKP